jgi:hypothetical protein
MDKKDRAEHETGVFDDPHDAVDPIAWGLLFAVIEGSRLWHERRHGTKATTGPRVAAGARSLSQSKSALRSGVRRRKA